MAITPATKPAPKTKRINLQLILDQLDAEWAAQDTPFADDDTRALLAYYQTAARVALHWISGDPYTHQFPTGYQDERLAKVCAYLRGQGGATQGELLTARDRQVTLLLDRTWPAYRGTCTDTMNYTGTGGLPAEFTFTWAGIDSLWTPDTYQPPMDAPAPYLPRFHSPESEAFHCNVLAVLFLNRAIKTGLCDLDVTPF
ncbi:hypothetical protein GCM10008956_15190 [Deinococcus arenae]|uniref:Uncharacterized protein n=1 Tax=Deinococcus arenae TaxID=1452751 RepID=A0A8H9GNQ0_9DEIO|nr:hypothetical protein [Deinococcus arenae]GGM39710.1 hypothetical protein GCM10008956_15190 [Deinococcus arenae]